MFLYIRASKFLVISCRYVSALALAAVVAGCSATETSHSITPQTTSVSHENYTGQRIPVAVGKMTNRSPYLNGVFSSGDDKLGVQATQILITHLSQSGRFNVMDRANLEEAAAEAKRLGITAKVSGAKLLISGAVTEFGRKETGSVGLGGVISKSRQQVMYGKVSLSAIDVKTSEVITTVAGAGEVQLGTKEVLGFGSRAGYDGTLADKVLDLASRDAVDALVKDLEGRGSL